MSTLVQCVLLTVTETEIASTVDVNATLVSVNRLAYLTTVNVLLSLIVSIVGQLRLHRFGMQLKELTLRTAVDHLFLLHTASTYISMVVLQEWPQLYPSP